MKRLAALLLLMATPALAGRVGLEWSPVEEPVDGYKVCRGLNSNPPNENWGCIDVGNVTTYDEPGVPNCIDRWFCVKAYNANGDGDWSEVVQGWARPWLSPGNSLTLRPGRVDTVTVEVVNAPPGSTLVVPHAVSVVVDSLSTCVPGQNYDTPQLLVATVTMSEAAVPGTYDLVVITPDCSPPDDPYCPNCCIAGTLTGGITIELAVPPPVGDARRADVWSPS